jgi:quinol monooxygenase YgiN
MSFVLVVRMTLLDESTRDEAVATMRSLADATRTEPGCELYIPTQDPENPRSFLFYEQYADKAAFEAHGASPHFQELAVGKLFGLMESPRERSFYETL